MNLRQVALCVALLGGMVGCRGCAPTVDSKRVSGGVSRPTQASSARAPAVLTGTVSLALGASLPFYPASAMERKVVEHLDPGTFPQVCTPPKELDRAPVRLSPEGKLVGVMVTASGFQHAVLREPITHAAVIKDCRLTPSLIVAMKGDALRITNEVSFPFMPALGQVTYNRTLMPGQAQDVKLDEPGVQPVAPMQEFRDGQPEPVRFFRLGHGRGGRVSRRGATAAR